jgi:peptidoglycan/LPS O-acetylase OafA/YrhL
LVDIISKYRSELMGFAIIWVILYHSGNIPFFNSVTSIGYGGVDIFLFLSGYGLFFSSMKKDSIITFYIKRFKRVMPTYCIVVLFTMICSGSFTFFQYLVNVSTIGFWLDIGYFEWYIPSLCMLYLFFPFFNNLFIKRPYFMILISLIITVILVAIRINYDFQSSLMLFITRIPIFSIGVLFGKFTFDKSHPKWINRSSLYIIALVNLISLFLLKSYTPSILWEYGFFWYPFIGITPGLCLLIASILEKINFKYLKNILCFFGALSLEIYLLHIKFFENSANLSNYFGIHRIIVLLLVLLLILPLSYLLSILVNRFLLLGLKKI